MITDFESVSDCSEITTHIYWDLSNRRDLQNMAQLREKFQ